MKEDLQSIRKDYVKGALKREAMPSNPFILFEEWLHQAIAADVNEPTAMLVSTVSPQGTPSARTVLLKGVEENEFVFYTNYNSRKGTHLAQNPHIALTFLWHEMERQVHVEGVVHRLPPEVSDAYFSKRPYRSRVGARISPQSQPIPSRIYLLRRFLMESSHWIAKEVERPDFWGGYGVIPSRFEFWQGRPSRLHDRFLYELKKEGEWVINRLAP